MPSALSEDSAPSASLRHLKAWGLPTHPRVPPLQLGNWPWPQAAARHRGFSTFQDEDFPSSTTKARGRPFHVVLTKADRLSPLQLAQSYTLIQHDLQAAGYAQMAEGDYPMTSATHHQGIAELWARLAMGVLDIHERQLEAAGDGEGGGETATPPPPPAKPAGVDRVAAEERSHVRVRAARRRRRVSPPARRQGDVAASSQA